VKRSARGGRAILGRILQVTGALLLLWAVLHLNSRSLGSAPSQRDFAHRRPYNQVKRSAHEAFPGFLLRAGAGGLCLWLGAWLLRSTRSRLSA
jgi:hypothetical protein